VSILKAYGVPHEVLAYEWGTSVDPAAIGAALERDRSIQVVFTTHSETSTGALNDLQAIAKLTRPREVILVADAITSVGVHPLPQDAWGVDVVIAGSQKGMMIPPGIATVALAPWRAAAIEGQRLPRFYFDLIKARKSLPLGETAFTPPVSLVLALEEALAMMKEEGLDQVHARHRRVAFAVQAGARALGCRLFAKHPAYSVTSLLPPEGVDSGAIVKRLRETHGIYVAGGQDSLKGKIFRIGHMGAYDLADVHVIIGALEECLASLGKPGAGADAAATAAREAWQTA
jgi:serine---pyruvate transaminase